MTKREWQTRKEFFEMMGFTPRDIALQIAMSDFITMGTGWEPTVQ